MSDPRTDAAPVLRCRGVHKTYGSGRATKAVLGISRDLAFLDPQGGRPASAARPARARNVRLHLPPRALRPPANPPSPAPLPAPSRSGADGGAGDAFG